jgi:hypothetical protein
MSTDPRHEASVHPPSFISSPRHLTSEYVQFICYPIGTHVLLLFWRHCTSGLMPGRVLWLQCTKNSVRHNGGPKCCVLMGPCGKCDKVVLFVGKWSTVWKWYWLDHVLLGECCGGQLHLWSALLGGLVEPWGAQKEEENAEQTGDMTADGIAPQLCGHM